MGGCGNGHSYDSRYRLVAMDEADGGIENRGGGASDTTRISPAVDCKQCPGRHAAPENNYAAGGAEVAACTEPSFAIARGFGAHPDALCHAGTVASDQIPCGCCACI